MLSWRKGCVCNGLWQICSSASGIERPTGRTSQHGSVRSISTMGMAHDLKLDRLLIQCASRPTLVLVEMDPQPFHPGEAGLGDVEGSVQGQLHERIVFDAKRAAELTD